MKTSAFPQDERDIKFNELASAQRGAPESAMLRCQHSPLGAGIGTWVLEHCGDLTHRMSERFSSYLGQQGNVRDKVEKCIDKLTNSYGFERELNGNMRANYDALIEDKYDSPRAKKLIGRTFEQAKEDFFALWDKYADAHSQLTVYNDAQKWARDAAIAMGRRDFNEALRNLYRLKTITDKENDEYIQIVGQYTPGKTATQIAPPLEFEVDIQKAGEHPDLHPTDNLLIVTAYLDKKKVGYAEFVIKRSYLLPNNTFVEKAHRRKGIASAIYAYAEKESGLKIHRSSTQTNEGAALWNNNTDRKFGSSDIEFMIDLGWNDAADQDLEQNTVIVIAMIGAQKIGEAEYLIKGDTLVPFKIDVKSGYEGLTTELASRAQHESGMSIVKTANLEGDGAISFFEPVENEHSVQPLRASKEASDKTPPAAIGNEYPNMDSTDGEGSNAYALMPERVEGNTSFPSLESLMPKAGAKKSYGVVMLDMPEGTTDLFKIDEEDLAGEGREDECHVTIKYGLIG